MLDDARKALHDLELACDALQRRKAEEADRYLEDVEVAVKRIRETLEKSLSREQAPKRN